MLDWFKAHRGFSWAVFWLCWIVFSPRMATIPGAIAILLGTVVYKERAVTPATIAAIWLSFIAFLLFGVPPSVRALLSNDVCFWLFVLTIFALGVLGCRYPFFGWTMLGAAGARGPYYYGRRRRW